jgi:predicted nucleic acid-binding protein
MSSTNDTLLGDVLVVDASVAAKWHLPDEDDVDRANELLLRMDAGEIALVAPDFIWFEVTSAITVATRGTAPRLTREEDEAAISEFLALRLWVESSRELLPRAFDLVHQHGCALYDALYLALADHYDIPFIMADRRLYDRVRHLPNVIWLADYAPSPHP